MSNPQIVDVQIKPPFKVEIAEANRCIEPGVLVISGRFGDENVNRRFQLGDLYGKAIFISECPSLYSKSPVENAEFAELKDKLEFLGALTKKMQEDDTHLRTILDDPESFQDGRWVFDPFDNGAA